MDPCFIDVLLPMTVQELQQQVDEALEDADSPVTAGEKVKKNNTIRLALVPATRRQAYLRLDARNEAREWLQEQTGVEDADDLNFEDLSRELQIDWNIMFQAADIIGALVPDQCEDWTPPDSLNGWCDVSDLIFREALGAALQLNPQWAAEAMLQGESEGNVPPGSQSNGESGTSDSEPG